MTNTYRRLIAAWAMLIGLTIALATAADVTHSSRLGAPWLFVIAVVTVAKVRLVLAYYLALQSNREWLGGLVAAASFTMCAVVASFIIVRP